MHIDQAGIQQFVQAGAASRHGLTQVSGVQMESSRSGKYPTALSSPAWLLRGISSIPGELRLTDSQIAFIAHEPGTAWDWQLQKLERIAACPGFMKSLKDGRSTPLFNEPLASICIRSPWYYFSGGLVLQIHGARYRVGFGKPANASSKDDNLVTAATMREVGKEWLRALELD